MGARCIDGVVLVADKKITKTNEIGSISFEYKNKLHAELNHVIFGISGSTETFGYFVNEIKDRIRKGDVILENVTNIIADKVLEINDKRHFYRNTFDLLTEDNIQINLLSLHIFLDTVVSIRYIHIIQ